MTLATRITLALLVPLAILIALAVWQVSLVQRLVEDNRRIAGTSLGVETGALRIREDLARVEEFADKLRLLGDPAYAEGLGRLVGDVGRELADIGGLRLEDPERAALERLTDGWRSTRPRLDRIPEVEPDSVVAAFDVLDRRLIDLTNASRATTTALLARDQADVARAARVSRWAAVLGILAAAALAVWLGHSLLEPVRRLGTGTREIAAGRFEHRIEPTGPPRLADLARDFNAMAGRLGELDALKEDLLSSVSHDLKAPLASMRETIRLLLDEIPGPLNERQGRLLAMNLESGDRLSAMITDLLDLSRIRAGAAGFEWEPADLAALAREAVGDLAGAAAEKDLEVTLDLPPRGPELVCDRAAVARVVRNLLANAVRFTPRGGRIEVRVAGADDGVVEVRDTGPGIPDSDKERVFERFYRVERGRKGGKGTGLGLAIALSIVDAHGGSIEIRDAEGGGSVFAVRLPASPPAVSEGLA